MSIYTRTALLNLLQRAKALGMDLGKGSSLEKMTVAQLEALVSGKEKEMSDPLPPFSARQLAEQVLAFREAYAPDKKRFHERALLVDNGERGSEQKAVVFTADDLSALLMDLRNAERQRDEWKAFAFKHPELTPPVVTQELRTLHAENIDLQVQQQRELDTLHRAIAVLQQRLVKLAVKELDAQENICELRQRLYLEVEAAYREGFNEDLMGSPDPLETDAAWNKSKAKARLT